MNDSNEPWYSARCVFRQTWAESPATFEERIVLLRAAGLAEAISLAEQDAREYAAESEACSWTGFVEVFHLFATEVGHRTEVFSLVRSSDLGEREYLDRFFDTGAEHRSGI